MNVLEHMYRFCTPGTLHPSRLEMGAAPKLSQIPHELRFYTGLHGSCFPFLWPTRISLCLVVLWVAFFLQLNSKGPYIWWVGVLRWKQMTLHWTLRQNCLHSSLLKEHPCPRSSAIIIMVRMLGSRVASNDVIESDSNAATTASSPTWRTQKERR